MKTLTVYNDVHLFGVHALDHIKFEYTNYDFHLGDNVDMKGVSKRKILQAKDKLTEIKKFSKHYCSGNHELDTDPETIYHAFEDILFTHGDYLVWGHEKADAWRKKEPGRSRWMRFALKIVYPLRRFKKLKISNDFKERCVEKAKEMNCNTVIMGHRHPKQLVDIEHKGVRIMILPRGKNTLEIEDSQGLIKINGVKHIRNET